MTKLLFPLLILMIAFDADTQSKVIVSQDGTGQFTSIQDAIQSLPKDKSPQTVYVKNGIYKEKIYIDRDNVTLIGQSKPKCGKYWKDLETKLNDKIDGVYVLAAISRDIFRCDHQDDWGAATINIRANDINIRNITAVNTFGYDLKEEYDFNCKGEIRKIRKDGHQFAFRTMPPTQRLTVEYCNFYSFGGDTVSPWDVENGTYYFNQCTMEGAVDFYCPRGWAYAENCHFICHNKNAAIWHDGREYEDSKSVIRKSDFIGDPDYKLGRYHRDAQIYLIDCTFSKEMADAEIYHVSSDTDIKWGKRIYYYNCKKKGDTYSWYKNNIDKTRVKNLSRDHVLGDRWNNPIPYVKSNDYPLPGNAKISKTPNTDKKADQMIIAQRSYGGWPKTIDGKTQPIPYDSIWSEPFVAGVLDEKNRNDATIDNGATSREIRYLFEAYQNTKNPIYLESAQKGVEYLIKMQYPSGGFPQFYPDTSGYRQHITYNDNAMINVMNLMSDIVKGEAPFVNTPKNLMSDCELALKKGLAIILKTQIIKDGKKTIWAAQYDHNTFVPAKARAYELPSYATSESAAIIKFLINLEAPRPEIKDAIIQAVHFLYEIQILGLDYSLNIDPGTHKKTEILLTENKMAKPLWARFYDLNTLEPIFCGRDGIIKHSIFEIEKERQLGYAWYGYWCDDLIEKIYPRWHKKYVGLITSQLTNVRDTSYNLNKALRDVRAKVKDAAFPKTDFRNVSVSSDVLYKDVDGLSLKMDIYHSLSASKSIPVVIIHGGGWRSGDKTNHADLAKALAQKGYTCFLPEYRLSNQALYPAPIMDIRDVLTYLEQNSDKLNIDISKLGIMGFSAGGQLASLIATAQNQKKFNDVKVDTKKVPAIKALVDIDGVIDFLHPDSEEGDDSIRLSASTLWFGANRKDRPDLYKEASAMTYVSSESVPALFIASGEARMRAGWAEYKQVLDKNGIYNEFKLNENAPHSFIFCEPWFTPTVGVIDSFFKKALIGSK